MFFKTAVMALWALLMLTGCPDSKVPKDPTKTPMPSASATPEVPAPATPR